MNQYQERDTVALGEHYVRHVHAMTSERLYAKSDIAAELAHRDAVIAGLLEALEHIHGVALAGEWRDLPGIAKTAKEAIAKATGEQK